jgi:hypothetical protein
MFIKFEPSTFSQYEVKHQTLGSQMIISLINPTKVFNRENRTLKTACLKSKTTIFFERVGLAGLGERSHLSQ